ncbi:putative aspartate kinase [Helianthus debilis subsp. tardiflorus]
MELARETHTEKRRDNRGSRDLLFPPSVLSTTVQASATPPAEPLTPLSTVEAVEKAASCVSIVSEIEELSFVKELHYRTVDELGLQRTLVTETI